MQSTAKPKSVYKNNDFKQSMKVYFWLLSFLKKYRGAFALYLLMGIVISSVLLVIPKFIQILIDMIIPNRDTGLFLTLLISMIPIIGIMIAAMAARNTLQRMIQENTSRDLQLTLFQHLRYLGFAYFEKNAVGESLSMFHSEVPAVQNIFRRYIPVFVEKTITVVICGILLVMINFKLTLLIIPCFLSYYLIGPFFEKKQSIYAKEGMERTTAYNQKIYDSLSALLELRVHGTESWDLGRLRERHEASRLVWLKEIVYALLRGTARRFTINFGAVLLFLFGAHAIKSGTMQIGEFVAFLFYYLRVMADLTHLITAATEQKMLLIQADKLYRFILRKPAVEEPQHPIKLSAVNGEILFNEVHFGYEGNRDVINGVTLTIFPGERVALVGTSGSGKSTLLKLVGRFYDPSQGSILLDGVSIDAVSFDQLRGALGYVFQETYLFGTSVKENIRFGNPLAGDDEIIKAAHAAYAHEFIIELPQGYDTLVGERGTKLSGGQKQRIAIARMFLKNPAIVLLDEATSALDNVSELYVQQALDRLLENRTTLAVDHRLSTIRDYDKIVVMEKGKISEIGSYEQLLESKGALYRLVMGEEELASV